MDSNQVRAKLRDYIIHELVRMPEYPLRDDEGIITGGLIKSFDLAMLGVFVEETFNIYIPDSDLTVEKMDTLDQMVARVLRG